LLAPVEECVNIDVSGVIDENVDGSFVLPTVEICFADDKVNGKV
jgi:hypothetical protein